MEFSTVSAGKTYQHKQTSRTNTENPSWPENCLCCGEDHSITIPPHDFRQQYNQQRFCPTIVDNKITIAETGCQKRTNSWNRENAASPLNQHVSRNAKKQEQLKPRQELRHKNKNQRIFITKSRCAQKSPCSCCHMLNNVILNSPPSRFVI